MLTPEPSRPSTRTATSSTALGSSSTMSTVMVRPCGNGNKPSSTRESHNSCREIGFCITAAAPSANPLLRSATIEMMTTGMWRSVGTCLRRSRNSQPSMSGSMMSSVMSDSGCCAATFSAASADGAWNTVKPCASSCKRMRSAALKSSSTTSAVRAPTGAPTIEPGTTTFGVVTAGSAPIGRNGSQTVKREPAPTLLCTATVPPWSSASTLIIARPSPVPSNLRASPPSIWLNGRNSRSSPSGVTPMPVSVTLISRNSVKSLSGSGRVRPGQSPDAWPTFARAASFAPSVT